MFLCHSSEFRSPWCKSAAIGVIIVAGTIYLCYGFSDRLSALIGPTGLKVIVKLTAFLLVCIGVQILWNGASQLITSLPMFRVAS